MCTYIPFRGNFSLRASAATRFDAGIIVARLCEVDSLMHSERVVNWPANYELTDSY